MTLDGAFSDDPIAWFQHELARATPLEAFDATRAALATVDADGNPGVRFVLVKRVDARGFVFFTNLESTKAAALAARPRAALVFHWSSIGVQARVEGNVVALPAAESDAYFATRPRNSQLAAWASNQSKPIASRAQLDEQLTAVMRRFPDNTFVPRPPHWGGLCVRPTRIEIWQDRDFRMHDRWAFTRSAAASDLNESGAAAWNRERLQP